MKIHSSSGFLYRAATLATAALALSGCVSTKYKMAPKNTPPPLALNLSAAPASSATDGPPPVEATVHTVIVYRGSGSWKRDAYWDEYVFSIANRSDRPLAIETATLTDFQGQSVTPGASPWELEKQSRSHVARLQSTAGNILKLGGGALASGTAGILGGAAMGPMIFGASWFGPVFEGAALGFVVAIPVYAGSSLYLNLSKKHKVETEFKHRRLALPATLVPGQVAQGSLFFRISPGPQRLVVHYRAGDEMRDLVVDLAPLAGLHLQTAIAPPAAL